jgi:hypothetical protein
MFMLRLVEQGLRDMEQTDARDLSANPDALDRILLGFVSIAVFGRSTTLALQNLRHFDESAYNAWYEPWEREMSGDTLLRWFNELRRSIVHRTAPLIAIVLGASGRDAPSPGTVTVPDLPPPDTHRGRPIEDRTTIGACRLYAAYLKEMIESGAAVILAVHDRHVESAEASNVE